MDASVLEGKSMSNSEGQTVEMAVNGREYSFQRCSCAKNTLQLILGFRQHFKAQKGKRWYAGKLKKEGCQWKRYMSKYRGTR